MTDAMKAMEAAWKAVTAEPMPETLYMVTSPVRFVRSVRRWRGKRFCVRITVAQAFWRACKWKQAID